MVLELTKSTADEIISANERVVIKFFAPWCNPCKILAPMFEGIAEEVSGVVFTQIDVDDQPELAAKYEILGVPTAIVLDNGNIAAKETGIPRINALLQRVKGGAL